MKIAIVTDSTAYLTDDEVSENNIRVVPIPFILEGQSYQEGIDMTTDEYYKRLKTAKTFPTTSQPPLGEMLALYESLRDEGYEAIISIHLASTISGLVNNLRGIVDAVEGIKIYPYDSKITVQLMGALAIKAAKLAREDKTPEEIISILDQLRATIDAYFVVDDLQHLARGGRLSNASAFIGTMLKVKPLLTFDNETNYIVPFEKVRSMKKALARAEELFDLAIEKADYPMRAIVLHTNAEEAGQDWHDALQQSHPDIPIAFSYIGPVIGTHIGPGTLALAWMRDSDSI